MSSDYHLAHRCRLCDRMALQRVMSLPATPLANAFRRADDTSPEPVYPLQLMLCGECGHTQLQHVVHPEVLYRDYLYASPPSMREHWLEYATSVRTHLDLRPNDLVIDIGSNNGDLLRAFQSWGLRVLGYEPARALAEAANQDGLPTLPMFFGRDTPLPSEGQARLITCNNCFAHIDDLAGVVEAVRRLLAPNGAFVFEVAHALPQVVQGCFDSIFYHEHLSTHALRPLLGFFTRHDLVLYDAQKVNTHGGSLRCFVRHTPQRVRASVADRVREEERAQLFSLQAYLDLAGRIQEQRTQLHTWLQARKWSALNGGGPAPLLGAYGAPAKMTPFCYALGLTREDVAWVVDESPLKQGRVSPGLHIPVVAPERMREERPADVLVFAWNMADTLIEKATAWYRAWRIPPPRFVVPLPTLRVESPS